MYSLKINRVVCARRMLCVPLPIPSHPIRVALLEVLIVHGSLTATQAGELVGESPTTCSFHLRQLAKYGFIEKAGERKGLQRLWQLVRVGMVIDLPLIGDRREDMYTVLERPSKMAT